MTRKLVTEIDRLFAGPLDGFTAERNALAKRLRDAGKSESADEVKALRKPTAAAAAVNSLALVSTKEVKAFYDLTEKLRRASSGRIDQARLRKLAREEGEVLEELVAKAADGGTPKSALDRVRETLQAGQVDPELREVIVAGRLEREQRSASIGLDNLVAPPRAAKRTKKPPTGTRADKSAAKAARKRRDEATAALEGARADEREATRGVARAEQALAKAERAQDAARSRVERAEAKLERPRAERPAPRPISGTEGRSPWS